LARTSKLAHESSPCFRTALRDTRHVKWPDGHLGRALAAVYVLTWAGLLTGLAWTVTDPATAGTVLFVAANVVIWMLAVGMRRRVPTSAQMTGYQRAWYRLTLGTELPTALRLVRGKP
jgi:hypothetical protein